MLSVFVLQTQRWGSVVCLCYRRSGGEVLSVFVLQTQRWGSVACVCVTDAAVGKC